MAAETKIRVDRLQLIEAIKTRREEAETKYEQDESEYGKKLFDWRLAAIGKLDALRDQVTRGEIISYTTVYLSNYPSKPKLDTETYDRHVKMLEMCPDETVTVNSTDFGMYLR